MTRWQNSGVKYLSDIAIKKFSFRTSIEEESIIDRLQFLEFLQRGTPVAVLQRSARVVPVVGITRYLVARMPNWR